MKGAVVVNWLRGPKRLTVSFRFGVCGCGSSLNGNTGQTV